MTARGKSLAIGACKFAVAVLLIWLLAGTGRLDLTVVARGGPILAVVAVVLYLQLLCAAWRWRLLLAAQDIPLRLSRAFSLTMIGALFGLALPGAVGGDMIKAYYIVGCAPERKAQALTTVLIDRLVGLLTLLGLASFAACLDLRFVSAHPAVAALFAAASAAFLAGIAGLTLAIACSRRTILWIQGFSGRLPGAAMALGLLEALREYRGRGMVLANAMLLGVCCQVLGCLAFYLCAANMGQPAVSLRYFLLLVPLGLITTALPISPAGIGVGQAAFFALFQLLPGSPGTLGANACTLFQFVMILVNLTGAVFYVAGKREMAADEKYLERVEQLR